MAKKKSLSELAADHIDYLIHDHSLESFKGLGGDYWVAITEDGKRKTMPLASNQWKGWLIRYSRKNDLQMSPQQRDEITLELGASAEDDEKRSVDVRVARTEKSIQVDLNDESYDAVHISDTQTGFKVGPPDGTCFYRPMKQQSLPQPVAGKREHFIEQFKRLMPELEFGHWLLALAFLLKALDRDRGSFVILVIGGPQGSGKTILSRRLKALIDPSEPPELSPPRNIDDIIVAARSSHLLVFENMSGLTHEMADVFCRLATGGGFSKRKNYTDHDEAYYKLYRPIIINGIDEPSNRPDFLDRCVVLELKPISQGQRIAETELNKEFEGNLPTLLGGVYSLLGDCLRIIPTIKEKNLPRMTDYALMGIAIERVLKLAPGSFLDIYNKNRNEQIENTFWNDDLCSVIYKSLEKAPNNRIDGTAHQLMKFLFDRDGAVNAPRKARGFTSWLKRIEPLLKIKGIVVDRPTRTAEKRLIVIRSERPIAWPKCKLGPRRPQGPKSSKWVDL